MVRGAAIANDSLCARQTNGAVGRAQRRGAPARSGSANYTRPLGSSDLNKPVQPR